MQCVKCGKKLKEGMVVCPSCGTGIHGEKPIKEIKDRKRIKNGNVNKKGSVQKILLIVLIVIFAAAFIFAGIFLGTANMRNYNKAVALYENNQYDSAEVILEPLADKNYKDSAEILKSLRYEWVDLRLQTYDYIKAERYVNQLPEDVDYYQDLKCKVYYNIGLLHEDVNPVIAVQYFDYTSLYSYEDSSERMTSAAQAADEMGQTIDDFDNPEATGENEGKTVYFKISIASFDIESEAEAYKNEVSEAEISLNPYVEQLEGKYHVLVATHAKLLEAHTRILSVQKLGYDPVMITDWVEGAVNDINNVSSILTS